MRNKVLSIVSALIVAFSLSLSLIGCADEGDKGSASAPTTISSYPIIDNPTLIIPESTSPTEEPQNAVKAAYPSLYAMYKSGIPDGSYTGTDQSVGFPAPKSRVGNEFETIPEGYGAGTTGGRGATQENIYECSKGTEIIEALSTIKSKQALDASVKSIIIVTSTITEENSGTFQIIVDSINNLSIIGSTDLSIFNGVGLNYKSSKNLIVQNLTIHHPKKSAPAEKDCLEFNQCQYVWVDHCEFYNDYPSDSSEKDYYDGLLDVKNESSHVTISYNNFHDSWKTSLVGSGPSDLYDDRTLTYHHNFFINCNSRMPLIRSGLAHLYNNYYENILSTGINLRIGAKGYVENNVFVNVKNPVCSIEETVGYWNKKGNVYQSCSVSSGSLDTTDSVNTCSFTPSYSYTLDETSGLKAYLDSTVGVGKIDVPTAIGEPQDEVAFTVDEYKVLDRSILELGAISLSEECYQKLLYLSQKVMFADDTTRNAMQNINTLVTAVNTYNDLYGADFDNRINALSTSGEFSEQALNCFSIYIEYNLANDLIKAKVTKKDKLDECFSHYGKSFASYFNNSLSALTDPQASDMDKIERLEKIYDIVSTEMKQTVDENALINAKGICLDKNAAEAFKVELAKIEVTTSLTAEAAVKLEGLATMYDGLSQRAKGYLSDSDTQKYNTLFTKLDEFKNSARKMDLSGVAVGRTTLDTTVAGDINIGKSTDIQSCTVSFEGQSYTKCVYLSGYGNAGSKCIQFTLFSASDVTLVLQSKDQPAKFLVTDENKVEKTSFISTGALESITIFNLAAGEYRIYTDIPDATEFPASQAYIYAVTITPAK